MRIPRWPSYEDSQIVEPKYRQKPIRRTTLLTLLERWRPMPAGTQTHYIQPPTIDYLSLNLEQQAQIVEDWYAGDSLSKYGRSQTNLPKDQVSPYYHFIINNVWHKLY